MNYKIKLLIPAEAVHKRIKELGAQISKDYKDKPIRLIGVLKGSVPFLCELMQNIENEGLTVDFMGVMSYGSGTKSSGVVKILKDLDQTIEGIDVLIAEDIIDSGITLSKLLEVLKVRNPKSIKVCALLDKPSRREVKMEADYIGFTVEDKFIVGYGLDYDQHHRELPYIGEVEFT